MRRLRTATALALVTTTAVIAPATASFAGGVANPLNNITHIVVIYAENHSFDNLWGAWPGVNGLTDPSVAGHVVQVGQTSARTAFSCLLQKDVNLTTSADPAPNGGLPTSCQAAATGGYNSAFTNNPFTINGTPDTANPGNAGFTPYIPFSATTCWNPYPPNSPFAPSNGVKNGTSGALAGGCTRDLVHRFYQEQFQIDGGNQDRYVTGSDAVGLAMGHYDTTQLPLYQYLTTDPTAPLYSINDAFFQAAFGGSFINHQFLVAAQAPKWVGALADGSANDLHSAVDANGVPNTYPQYTPVSIAGATPAGTPPFVKDGALTVAADSSGNCKPSFPSALTPPAGTVCGDYAINTIQPFSQPYSPGTAVAKRLPEITTSPAGGPYNNIGDALSANGNTWAWFAGGWDNAAAVKTGPGWTNGSGPVTVGTNTQACQDSHALSNATWPNCPDALFQFHHQAFNYFQNYASVLDGSGNETNTVRQTHLLDEQDFINSVTNKPGAAALPSVSFVKPLGDDNSHPGYGSEQKGDQHLVDLIKDTMQYSDWAHTMIVITYDEFGGQWDHVSPPQPAAGSARADSWGPGTRIPEIVLSPWATGAVDHSPHDTTSILTTIEHRFGLQPLASRDGGVADLSSQLTNNPAPPSSVPESPLSILLPLSGAAVAGLLLVKRGRHKPRLLAA